MVAPLQPAAALYLGVCMGADCEHEVKPVTSGHRLCLIYNLVHTGRGPAPRFEDFASETDRLRAAVQAWAADTARPPLKLCFLLEHL